MNGLLFAGMMFIAALRPLPAPVAQTPLYTTTVTSNVPATIGCIWADSPCDVQCSSCRSTTCIGSIEYSTVGTCLTVTGDLLSWNAVGSAGISTYIIDGYLQALWSGYTYQGAQTLSYQISMSSVGDGEWAFPTEPLLPYSFSEPDETIDAPITSGVLWEVARIALTAYNVVSGGDAAVWLAYAGILLLPIAGMIIYRLLTSPPEI